MEELYKSNEMNQRYFWYIANKNKVKKKSVHPLKVDKSTLTDVNEIRVAWKQYFETLYTPSYPEDDESVKFISHVKDMVKLYETLNNEGK